MKKKLLDHLLHDVYCRLAPSTVHGIGVIAIKDIPKGVNPFTNLSTQPDKIITLTSDDIKNVDPGVKKILKDFFGTNKSDTYDVLYYGPNDLNISYYLNHSLEPNLDLISGKSEYYEFMSNRVIEKGEELFINYKLYDK